MARLPFFFLFHTLCRLSRSQFTAWNVPPNPVPNPSGTLRFDDDPIYVIGDELELQWVTDKNQYSIFLWQQSLAFGSAVLGSSIYTKILGGAEPGKFKWTITPQTFDLSQSNVFWLSLGYDQTNLTECMISHYFNLTQTSEVSSSATLSPTPSSILSSTAASNPLTTSANPSPSQSSAVSPNDERSQGIVLASKVGLGVGLGIGIPFLFVIAYLVITQVRRHRKRKIAPTPPTRMYEEGRSQNTTLSPQELCGFENNNPEYGRGGNGKRNYREALAELPGGRQSMVDERR